MKSIFELAQSSIKLGGFNLDAKLRELTSIMLVGQIAPDEYDELTRLAADHADTEADSNDTNILGALRTINTEIVDIKARIAKLEAAGGSESVADEYPEWERWNGDSSSGYRFGAKVTHLGIKYVSNYIGLNVWEPGLLGTEALWTVVG